MWEEFIFIILKRVMTVCWLKPGCIGVHVRNKDAEYGRSGGSECI